MVKMDNNLDCVGIVLERMQNSVKCAICFDMMVNPYSTKCGHSFCLDCLDRVLIRAKTAAKCPLCMTGFTKRSLTKNGKIQKIVAAVNKVLNSIKADCGVEVVGNVKKEMETTPATSINTLESESEGGPRRSARKKETPVSMPSLMNDAEKENKKTEPKKDQPTVKNLKKKPPLPKKAISKPKVVLESNKTVKDKVKEWLEKSSNAETTAFEGPGPSKDIFSQQTVLLNPTEIHQELNKEESPINESPIKAVPEKLTKKSLRKCTSIVNMKQINDKKLAKSKMISKSTSDLPKRKESHPSSTISSTILSDTETGSSTKKSNLKKNLRFASDNKTTLLDQAKSISNARRNRNVKSPVDGRNPKSTISMLNITGGEEKPQFSSRLETISDGVLTSTGQSEVQSPPKQGTDTLDPMEVECHANPSYHLGHDTIPDPLGQVEETPKSDDPNTDTRPHETGVPASHVEEQSSSEQRNKVLKTVSDQKEDPPMDMEVPMDVGDLIRSPCPIQTNKQSRNLDGCSTSANETCDHRIPCEVFIWLKKFFSESSCSLETQRIQSFTNHVTPLCSPSRVPDRRDPSTDSSVTIEYDRVTVANVTKEKCIDKLVASKPVEAESTLFSPVAKQDLKRKRCSPPNTVTIPKIIEPSIQSPSKTPNTKAYKTTSGAKRFKRIQDNLSDESDGDPMPNGDEAISDAKFEMDSEEIRDYDRLDNNILNYFEETKTAEVENLPDPEKQITDESVSSEDEIPATEELLSNIKQTMIQPISNYANSESSVCSGMGYLSETTQHLIERGNKSFELANKIFDASQKPTDMPQPELPVPGRNPEVVDISAFSTQSVLATTQKQQVVQQEVSDLKSRISALEELQKQKANLFQQPNKESDNESEDLFNSQLSPRKRKLGVAPNQRVTRKGTALTKTIICTGLSQADILSVRQFVEKMCNSSSQVLPAWSKRVTHVIVRTDENNKTERTLKYLYGTARGCWILSLQWVIESLAAGHILQETDFEVLDCTGVEGPRNSRLSSSLIFSDCAFCVVPPFSELTEDQLLELLQLCGAVVVKTVEDLALHKRSLKLILVDINEEENAPNPRESYDYVKVASDWIMECIGVHRHIAIPPYIIGQPNNKQLVLSNIPNQLLIETQDVL